MGIMGGGLFMRALLTPGYFKEQRQKKTHVTEGHLRDTSES